MRRKSRKLLSALSALLLMFGLFTTVPFTTQAASPPFQVIEHPVGAVYQLNASAVALRATFEYINNPLLVEFDTNSPIKVRWYVSNSNSTTDRSNEHGEYTIPYSRYIRETTLFVPATNVTGISYYYAVLTYSELKYTNNNPALVTREVVTNTARIDVIDGNREGDFPVLKLDENGYPLAGAVMQLIPDSNYLQSSSVRPQESTTASNGYAWFDAVEGYYILSEKQAPRGYNATDEKHYIIITKDGVYFHSESNMQPYSVVDFINKKIPELNLDDHFAFMQGYPSGTFLPSKNMTRAEAVVMFSRLLSKSMDLSIDHRNNYYPDINPEIWYASQVGYMQTLGVLADYSRDGNFRPEDPVTRAEFSTLAAHFDNLVLTNTNAFTDVSLDHWAVKYINSAAAKGWIEGYDDGTFKPDTNITRAQVVTLVGRMLNRFADLDYLAANSALLPRVYSDLPTGHWAYGPIMEASTGHDYYRDSSNFENWTSTYS